jgi:cold shock CspA family protein
VTDKVVIGTVKIFDKAEGRGVIVPREIPNLQTGQEPVYFRAPKLASFRAGQLVRFVLDAKSQQAKDVVVLSEMGE